ncbi:hypothetical protein [Kingella potus]|uniref:hypothetical protein n=1 Tax=Kingella potus TaxID=265175 RepID=UPI001FD63070|nr:hypothetical protein [Kingella potus]UOO99943.1 hypothetical protein LVJ84_07725 [Kingella potus]
MADCCCNKPPHIVIGTVCQNVQPDQAPASRKDRADNTVVPNATFRYGTNGSPLA